MRNPPKTSKFEFQLQRKCLLKAQLISDPIDNAKQFTNSKLDTNYLQLCLPKALEILLGPEIKGNSWEHKRTEWRKRFSFLTDSATHEAQTPALNSISIPPKWKSIPHRNTNNRGTKREKPVKNSMKCENLWPFPFDQSLCGRGRER